MADFLNFGNRLKNIFAPSNPIIMDDPRNGGITGNLPRINWGSNGGRGVTLDSNNDILDTVNKLYTPDHTYSDMYRNELGNMPERPNPGKVRQIFGFMAGLGKNGPQNEENVLYGNYGRKLNDWQERMKALQPGMISERSENVNERMLAHQTVSDILRDRDISRKTDLDNANIKIRQERADAYVKAQKYKEDHPKHELKAIPGGNYVFFNPEDPTEDPIDTGIKSGTLSKIEEINLGQKNALQRIAATGSESRKTAKTRGDIESGLIKERGAEARTTKASPSDTGTETTTETTVTGVDAQGKPTGIKRRQVKKPLVKIHRMQYTDKAGKLQTIRVPEDKVKEATSKGAKDLGVIP